MVFPAFWLVKNSAINPQIASFNLSAIKEWLINRIFLNHQLHLASESSQQTKPNYMHSISTN